MSFPRLHFVNRFYWPDEPATAQLLTDLAGGLAARGWPVSVVTSRPSPAGVPARETHDGVAIARVRTTHLGRRSLVGRGLDFVSFYLGAGRRLWREVRRGDVVVALTDPPLIGVLAGWIAARRGAHLVHWVQDIYPEVAVQVTGHRTLLVTRGSRNRAWRRALGAVVPGSDMARALTGVGVPADRVLVQPNWAPAGLAPATAAAIAALRQEWGLADKFVLAYSGNLGRVHDLDSILAVAAALSDDPAFVVAFIGGGAQRPAIEAAVRARALSNVRFFPAQPRARLAASLGVGDVHFVTLRPGADRWVFPSKLHGIAAVGRPALFIGAADCEIARLIRTQGIGANHTHDDALQAAARLRHWRAHPAELAAMSAAARKFAAADATDAIRTWHEWLSAKLAQVPATH